MLSTSFLHYVEKILFHSLCTAFHILYLLEIVFPYREQEIIDQIFSIGFKSWLWPGQKISSIEFSAYHF